MYNQTNDIKRFGQLRKQLAPVLNNSHKELLERIEGTLGEKNVTPQLPLKQKLSHDQRVYKHLKL